MSLHEDYHYLVLKQQFPRIALGIELRWGSKDLEPYILGLINDTRDHTRQGFPTEIYNGLQSLLMYHHKLFPSKRFRSNDIWDSTFGDIN